MSERDAGINTVLQTDVKSAGLSDWVERGNLPRPLAQGWYLLAGIDLGSAFAVFL